MSGITLEGKVIKADHITGSRDRNRGGVTTTEHFDYWRLRFYDEAEGDFHDVKFDNLGDYKYEGDVPKKGDTAAVKVSLTPYKDETSGRALVALRALRPAVARPAIRQAS